MALWSLGRSPIRNTAVSTRRLSYTVSITTITKVKYNYQSLIDLHKKKVLISQVWSLKLLLMKQFSEQVSSNSLKSFEHFRYLICLGVRHLAIKPKQIDKQVLMALTKILIWHLVLTYKWLKL